MTYRELLNSVKDSKGWVRTKENMVAQTKIKYLTWVEKMEREYEKQKMNKS